MSDQERDPLIPRAAPDEEEAGFVGRAIRATNNLSRKALIFTVLVSTFVGTVLLVLGLYGLAALSPSPVLNYAVLGREIGALQKEFGIKGFAVGVVKDGELQFAQGYGVRNEQGEPVDEDTIFEIGSNSKSFTSFAIALLAQEGLLSYKEPITKYLPDFELKDRVASEQATLIDLLSHRTGLPRHELMWIYDAEDLVTHLKYLDPTLQFREGFQYNNLMYSVAGHLAGKVHGKGWHHLITEKIFKPLGMTRSFTKFPEARNQSNFAQGFAAVFEGGYPLALNVSDSILNVAPAGSISSSVKDMAKWLDLFLKKGSLPCNNVSLTPENFNRIVSPHMNLEVPPGSPVDLVSYGLGLSIYLYNGKKVVWHNGGTLGQTSYMGTVPEDNLAVVVLTNTQDGFADFLGRHILNKILFPTNPPNDFIESYRKVAKRAIDGLVAERDALLALRKTGSAEPLLPLDSYVGTYSHPGYGRLELYVPIDAVDKFALHGRLLDGNISTFKLETGHWVNNTFGVFTDNGFFPRRREGSVAYGAPVMLMTFAVENGTVAGLSLPLEPSLPEIVFKRV
ncbi:hypothetical protein HDU96_007144 [Phlyctochytrium bullatum]|nr:hypothetical protein HDU96_007144 [Phlyctochytrium bullatum]